jgi:tetratricopeptide (TPR) repeat protein
METEDKEIRGLIDDFKKHPGQFMFFLGAGFSSEIGLPIGKELADMLKKSFEEKGFLQKGADDTEEMGLDSLISLLLNKRISRDVICAEIKKILEGKRNPATNISGEDFFGLFYKIITEAVLSLDKSQTPGQICIATTNWDEALSEVFGDKALSIYSGNEVVKRKEVESKRIVIYQLHGSIKDCKSLLLTNEDKSQIKEKERILWDSFKADADKRRIIFIGYSLSDEDILDVYFKARTGLENIREKDFIIVNREESKEEIEERLSENNLQDIADVRVLNAFNFLIEMKESMGLVTGEETIELQTEGKINEKLENGVIVAGYPLSGLTTLYLKYYSRLPDRKLCIERYKHNPYDKNSFTDIMNGLRKGQKVALFIPEYTFRVYLDEYLEENRNELQTDLEKDIKKYNVVSHTVSKKEANEFLEKLIHKSKVKEKFDNDLKEGILNLVKQTERDGFVIPRNTETYPLKLLKDVFERTQKRFANNEQPDKIKKDLDRKIEVKDETEKLLDAGILLGITQVGEEVPNLLRLIPQGLYKNVKQLSQSITFLLGIAAPPALALVAVASIFLEIKEYLKHRGEKKTTQLDKYLQLKEYWDSLSDSERKMLCYKLDKKNKLKPGASEIYLNYIFMDRWEDVKKEVNEIKNKLDGFEDRLKTLEADYPKIMELLNELSQVNESIKLIKDEIESLKERIERLKEELYSTGAEKIENIKTLKDKLVIQDEDENLIGLGDSKNEIIVKDKISKIISISKDHVCIIEGEAGSGKTTLLYMIGKSLLEKGDKLYYIVEPSNFSFQKFRNLDAYALYDIRDPEIANEILRRKLREDIEGNVPLAKVIISVRTSYLRGSSFNELRREEGFKSVYEAHAGYNESILQEMAIRRLRNSFPNLSQDDLDNKSKILARKSEGLPLYIKEAVKMLKEKGSSLEVLNNLPLGTANMILSILSEEGERDSSLIFVYFLVANYPRFPQRLLEYIENFFGIHTPNYIDESSYGKLFLHTWYRDVLYSLMNTKNLSDIFNKLDLSEDSRKTVTSILESLKKSIVKKDIFNKINNNYKGLFVGFTNKYPNNPVLKELNRYMEGFFDNPNSVKPLDLSDTILLSSILDYVNGEIRKNDANHYGFNILKEKIDYSRIEPSSLGAYNELIGFIVNGVAVESSRISEGEIRPFYLFLLIASMNLFYGKAINTLEKEFSNIGAEGEMNYEEILDNSLSSSYVIQRYVKAFFSALRSLGFLTFNHDNSTKQVYRMALIYTLELDFEDAIEEYDKAIKLDPSNPWYHYNKGSVLDELQRHEEAIEEFDKAIELNPSHPRYHNNKGIALRKLHRYQDAIEEYDKAIKLDPSNPWYHYNKGSVLRKLHRYQEAIEEFDKAIELNPSHPRYHYNKGNTLYDMGKYPEAIEEYDKAIKLDPSNPWYHNNKGGALDELQRHEEAIEEFDKAIELNPSHPRYHYNKGIALRKLHRYQEAIEEFDKAIELDPSNPR